MITHEKLDVGGSATHAEKLTSMGSLGPWTHFRSFRYKISTVLESSSEYDLPPIMIMHFIDPSYD